MTFQDSNVTPVMDRLLWSWHGHVPTGSWLCLPPTALMRTTIGIRVSSPFTLGRIPSM